MKRKIRNEAQFDFSDTPDHRDNRSPAPVFRNKPAVRTPARPGAKQMSPVQLPGLPPDIDDMSHELEAEGALGQFDFSDTPDHRGSRSPAPIFRNKQAVRTPARKGAKPMSQPQLRGLPPDIDDLSHELEAEGRRALRREATPFGGPQKKPGETGPNLRQRSAAPTKPIPMGQTPMTPQAMNQLRGGSPPTMGNTPRAPAQGAPAPTPVSQSQGQGPGRQRSGTQTQQVTPHGMDPNAKQIKFRVNVPGVGTYDTEADSPERAKLAIDAHLKSGDDPNVPARQARSMDMNWFTVEPVKEGLSSEGLAHFRQLVNQRIQEIVRKKEGGGGYNLFPPNKGKKNKAQKAVGEFPTRLAAKRAELARFPPKDPEQLRRARARLDKLTKDPEKRQAQEREDLTGVKTAKKKKSKSTSKKAAPKKTTKEQIINRMVGELTERLFKEDEIPGSPWDERISSLDNDSLGSDKKLHKLLKNIEAASQGALGQSHKTLAKVLRGMAKVNAGDVMRDPDRGKMYMPISIDLDGDEIGPIHLYVDGGNVCIEISPEAREMIGGLDPSISKGLRGGLMSFQEDHLPKIDGPRKAWTDRDSYLDGLQGKLEKSVGGMSAVELYLAKQMMNKRRR